MEARASTDPREQGDADARHYGFHFLAVRGTYRPADHLHTSSPRTSTNPSRYCSEHHESGKAFPHPSMPLPPYGPPPRRAHPDRDLNDSHLHLHGFAAQAPCVFSKVKKPAAAAAAEPGQGHRGLHQEARGATSSSSSPSSCLDSESTATTTVVFLAPPPNTLC